MVEYGLILALVAVICIVSMTSIGKNISDQLAYMVTKLPEVPK